jgi:hypothetical protein
VVDDLVATLAEQRTKDGRNVAVIALRKRLVFVQHLIQRCKADPDRDDAATSYSPKPAGQPRPRPM